MGPRQSKCESYLPNGQTGIHGSFSSPVTVKKNLSNVTISKGLVEFCQFTQLLVKCEQLKNLLRLSYSIRDNQIIHFCVFLIAGEVGFPVGYAAEGRWEI